MLSDLRRRCHLMLHGHGRSLQRMPLDLGSRRRCMRPTLGDPRFRQRLKLPELGRRCCHNSMYSELTWVASAVAGNHNLLILGASHMNFAWSSFASQACMLTLSRMLEDR